MPEQLRVLFVEDVPADAELELRELRRGGLDCVMQRVETQDAFERGLEEFDPHLILSDFSLPTFDGMSALEIARRQRPDTPFIFVSGTIGEERAIEALKHGATDYVLKTNLRRLVTAVQRALRDVEDRAARRRAEERLRESEYRFQIAARATNDAIWDWDLATGAVWWNEGVHRLFGYPLEEVGAGAEWWKARIHSEDRERVWRDAWAVIDGRDAVWTAEYRFLKADGSHAHVLDRGYVMRDEQGRAYRMIGAMADLTERKRQELKIARLSRIHAVLSGINAAIVRVRDRDELLREACRIAIEQGGYLFAWVGMIDRPSLDIKPVARLGEERGFLGRVRLSADESVPGGRGATGLAIRTGRPVLVNDVARDGRLTHRAETLESGFHSFVVLPIMIGSAATGALYLYAGEPGHFDQEEMRLLTELAGDISFALEHIEKQERLDYLSYYDVLTGLPNRTLFHERVNQLVRSARQNRARVAVAVLNLQRFAIINDTLGRNAGDDLLRQVAERLSGALAERGSAARMGADTFAAALQGMRDEADAARLLEEEVLACLKQPFRVGDEELRIAARLGVAMFPGDGADADSLYRNAEAALKQAKESGERYLFYAPQMNARIAETLSLENRLRIALLDDQFVLHYQPKVDVATGRLCGLEALLRWESPDLGLVAPAQFVPILEDTGMILDVGAWAIVQAARDHAAWRAKGYAPPRIAVNVSGIQLRQRDFVERVKAALAAGICGCIDLEITESMIMEDLESVIRKLAELRADDVRIAIDDFGTGYSSLSYLARLPVDALKIDRSFVADMNTSPEHLAIVSTVISLARALNLRVIAEGVETQEQWNLLKLLKCDELQGYVFSRPLPAADLEPMLAKPGGEG